MSGHSKWSTIKRQKEATDKKRGQVFTKLGRAITIAVRDSGGVTDSQTNFRLRLAIEKARAANMPKVNIDRAIKRGSGEVKGEEWKEVTYEGFGPSQVGIIVECLTDNRQRTSQAIRNIFDKNGGSLAGPGAVSYQFEKAGFLTVRKPADVEKGILKIMDIGVGDVEEASDAIEIYVRPSQLEVTRDKLVKAGFEVSLAELVLKPKVTVPIKEKPRAQKILDLMEKLEDLDETQKVYANFDIADEILN